MLENGLGKWPVPTKPQAKGNNRKAKTPKLKTARAWRGMQLGTTRRGCTKKKVGCGWDCGLQKDAQATQKQRE